MFFYLSIKKSENNSMMSLNYYFIYNYFMIKNISDLFFNDYDIPYVFTNDTSAIISLGLIMLRGKNHADHF